LNNLTYLCANHNHHINDINHLTKLNTLCIWGNSTIGDKGIFKLTNLTWLNSSDNPNIININHLHNLNELHAGGNCGISDKGISKLTNLTKLQALNNFKITFQIPDKQYFQNNNKITFGI
jgi:hypothetical protein